MHKGPAVLPSAAGRFYPSCRPAVFTPKMSDERHACLAALTTHAVGPDAGLGFADVGFVEEYHAQAALAYSASDREGKRTFEQAAMEEEACLLYTSPSPRD